MGYQLWVSPTTGYRRTGTRLTELRSLLDAGITAGAILEPLESCNSDTPAQESAILLRRRNFDVAGLIGAEEDSPKSWINVTDLKDGMTGDYAQEIRVGQLVTDSTPLAIIFKVLKKEAHVFVLVGAKALGIVTRADLNKPPVRMYLFSVISLLEMHLSFWVKSSFPDDSWVKELKRDRVEAAESIRALLQKRKQDPYLVDCLQFCDRRTIIVRNDVLREKLGLGSRTKAKKFLEDVEVLRNMLAHSQHDLAADSPWASTLDLIELMETMIQVSDELVEQAARAA